MAEHRNADAYIDREEWRDDSVDPERMARLAATLDRTWGSGMRLPPLAHFVLFRPWQRQSLIGPDGHALRGGEGIIPDIDLPRRMWAGSRMTFHRPLLVGEAVTRRSRLVTAEHKVGRSGAMLFCTVEHVITGETDEEPAIVERQDIVYRAAHQGPVPAPRPAIPSEFAPSACALLCVDPVMLFRYSALTFNSHRIHYDRPYALEEEGYGGLVVHGPLLATLMLDHLERHYPDRIVRAFSFRAVSPVLDGEEIRIGSLVAGAKARLSIASALGLAMRGEVILAL